MTRRERLERKLEKRIEWAGKAEARSDAHYETGHRMFDAIPLGQPILIGHHSEKRDRNYRSRASGHMDKFVAERKLAEHHEQCASGIEHALDRSIFSDDANAIDALEQRIAANEEKRERMKLVNKLYRKGDAAGLAGLGLDLESLRARLKDQLSWMQVPHPAYELSNLGGRITTDKKRLGFVKCEQKRKAEAEAKPTGIVVKRFEAT